MGAAARRQRNSSPGTADAPLIAQGTDRVDAQLLDQLPDLRIVCNVAVGYNNIDVAAARERKIVVTNTPDVLNEACAALTWGLILGVTRRLGEGSVSSDLGSGRVSSSIFCSAWIWSARRSA